LKRWILAIADDLTGALEVGAKFAGFGVPATVTTVRDVAAPPTTRVLVIDTETRHLSAHDAVAAIQSLANAACRAGPWLVYKKTDSTLRGNIAAELRALLDVWPDRRIVFSGAYPALGRTVRNGQLLVHGMPVHETEFAADPLNPVTASSIQAILAGLPATVLDGESDGDVIAAASQVLQEVPTPISAGPAALAGALAGNLGDRDEPCLLPQLNRILVVNGSRHPGSRAQIEYARSHGLFSDHWAWFDEVVDGEGMERALRTGERVRQRLESSTFDALVVFGGDTAFGVHRALGSPQFESICEIVPGAPLSRSASLHWITKAGGFGTPDLLCEIRKRLS